MVNVILSSDDITVLGGPSRLDVDLNVGASGVRGSIILNGFGNPNLLVPVRDFITVPQVFDIFIDADPGSPGYLQAYQYVNQDGAQSWIPIFKLTQDVYKLNRVLSFSEGVAETLVNLTELGIDSIPFDSFNNSSAYFNVMSSISNVNVETLDTDVNPEILPSSSSILVGDAYYSSVGLEDPSDFPLILPLKFYAVEFNGSAWSEINNKKVIAYLTISFADPNNIFVNFGGDS